MVLASKIVLYKQMFCKSGSSELNESITSNQQQILKYFKIMESAGSKDLFVFYEMLIWGIRERNIKFIDEQINQAFPKIIADCLVNRRTLDRFLAFFTP